MPTKVHDCISKVRKELMNANPKIKTIHFELSTIANADGSKQGMTGQAIQYTWEEANKKGIVKTQRLKTFVTHKYCPFCGKKY